MAPTTLITSVSQSDIVFAPVVCSGYLGTTSCKAGQSTHASGDIAHCIPQIGYILIVISILYAQWYSLTNKMYVKEW